MRVMPKVRSLCSTTFSVSTGAVKLGHPQPLSNFLVEVNSGSPETMSTYSPASWWSQNSLRKAGSVALSCVTEYWWGVNRANGLFALLVLLTHGHSFFASLDASRVLPP